MSNPARQDVAHHFTAYHIDGFMPRAEFYRRLQAFIDMIKGSRAQPRVDELLLPGDLG